MISASSALLGRELQNCVDMLMGIASDPTSHVSWFTYSGLLSSLSNAMTLATKLGGDATSMVAATVLGGASAAESRTPIVNVLSQAVMLATAETMGWKEWASAASMLFGFVQLYREGAAKRAVKNTGKGGVGYVVALVTTPADAAKKAGTKQSADGGHSM